MYLKWTQAKSIFLSIFLNDNWTGYMFVLFLYNKNCLSNQSFCNKSKTNKQKRRKMHMNKNSLFSISRQDDLTVYLFSPNVGYASYSFSVKLKCWQELFYLLVLCVGVYITLPHLFWERLVRYRTGNNALMHMSTHRHCQKIYLCLDLHGLWGRKEMHLIIVLNSLMNA